MLQVLLSHIKHWKSRVPKSRASDSRSRGYKFEFQLSNLTLVLLNPDIPCLCKQCRSRSVGFWRSQLIWICTVCHWECRFIATIRIKKSDWLKIRSGCGILIYSAGQGWRFIVKYFVQPFSPFCWFNMVSFDIAMTQVTFLVTWHICAP